MREIASRIRENRPRPSMNDTIPFFATSTAVHAVADALDSLAEAIDPTPPAERTPFNIEAARRENAALGERIQTMKGTTA